MKAKTADLSSRRAELKMVNQNVANMISERDGIVFTNLKSYLMSFDREIKKGV